MQDLHRLKIGTDEVAPPCSFKPVINNNYKQIQSLIYPKKGLEFLSPALKEKGDANNTNEIASGSFDSAANSHSKANNSQKMEKSNVCQNKSSKNNAKDLLVREPKDISQIKFEVNQYPVIMEEKEEETPQFKTLNSANKLNTTIPKPVFPQFPFSPQLSKKSNVLGSQKHTIIKQIIGKTAAEDVILYESAKR